MNSLLQRYNEQNPDNKIQAGDFKEYDHGTVINFGQDRPSFLIQIKDDTMVELEYDRLHLSDDEYYDEAIKWIKALYPDAKDSDIDDVWTKLISKAKEKAESSMKVEGGTLDGLNISYSYEQTGSGFDNIKLKKVKKLFSAIKVQIDFMSV